jgi:hypothetical protein
MEGSEQRQRQRLDHVVLEAQRLYRAAGGRGIELTIQFNAAEPITAANRRSLPKRLAELATQIETRSSCPVAAARFAAMPEIASIWLNSLEWPDALWRNGQVYQLEEMSVSRLQAIVGEKESKASDYAVCDAYWLLICVEWMDRAQDQEIRIEGLKLASNIFEKSSCTNQTSTIWSRPSHD